MIPTKRMFHQAKKSSMMQWNNSVIHLVITLEMLHAITMQAQFLILAKHVAKPHHLVKLPNSPNVILDGRDRNKGVKRIGTRG